MYNTYKQFKVIAINYGGDDDFESLSITYKKDQSSDVLAAAYCKWYPYALKLTNSFSITPEEKASISVMAMHKALMSYDPDRVNSKVVPTIYRTILLNDLRMCWRDKEAVKTGSNNETSFDDITSVVDNHASNEEEEGFSLTNCVLSLCQLSEREAAYCFAVMADAYTTDAEFAHDTGISRAGVNHLKKRLRKKFTVLNIV